MVIRDTQWNSRVISIPESNKAETYALTLEVSQNTTIYCNFNVLSNFIYVDDISLTAS